MESTYKNKSTTPAARIRLVVFDHAVKAADLVYSHASSIVKSPEPAAAIFVTSWRDQDSSPNRQLSSTADRQMSIPEECCMPVVSVG